MDIFVGLSDGGTPRFLEAPYVGHIVIGGPGSGKTVLLKQIVADALQQRAAAIIFDAGGDLGAELLGAISPRRIKDVMLIDRYHAATYNPLDLPYFDLNGNRNNELIAENFINALQKVVELHDPDSRLTTRMVDVLRGVLNTMLAEEDRSLVSLHRRLLAFPFRKNFPEEYQSAQRVAGRVALLIGTKEMKSILEGENRIDIARIADERKILIVNGAGLSPFALAFLGMLFTNEVMTYVRSFDRDKEYNDLLFMVDEFHLVCNPDFGTIFATARKCKVACFLAHQNLSQVPGGESTVRLLRNILSSAQTKIVFRLSYMDAVVFGPETTGFKAEDIRDLPNYTCIVRMLNKEYRIKTILEPPYLKSVAKKVMENLSTMKMNPSDYFREGWF